MRAIVAWAAAVLGLACAVGARPAPRADAGARAYQKCYSCHALEPGKDDLEGPSLNGIVGRRIASSRGFGYSPAMRRFAARKGRWTPELLDRFVADPEAVVPRTSMNYPGMRSEAERKALVRFLERPRR